MPQYPNYRVSVEMILVHEGKALITKRADNCDVSPNIWSIPAGKVKYEEVPKAAAVRELKEEVGINAHVVKELSCRTGVIKSNGEDAYRLFFTYLMQSSSSNGFPEVILNEEHSEYAWVDKKDLMDKKYDCMRQGLKEILNSAL